MRRVRPPTTLWSISLLLRDLRPACWLPMMAVTWSRQAVARRRWAPGGRQGGRETADSGTRRRGQRLTEAVVRLHPGPLRSWTGLILAAMARIWP